MRLSEHPPQNSLAGKTKCRPRFQREYTNQKQPVCSRWTAEREYMEQIQMFKPEKEKRKYQPKEWRVVALRECPTPERLQICDTPEKAVEYWRMHIATSPQLNAECECLVVILLNTRRKVKGHQIVTIGTMDSLLAHPREVFRTAVVGSAAAVVLMHNHPSGEPSPSEADIKVTRDLFRAGQLLKIEVLDHVIIGNPNHASLREMGCLNQ